MIWRLRHPKAKAVMHDTATPKADPTGTKRLRMQYRTQVELRWRKLLVQLKTVVVDQDMLGLTTGKPTMLGLSFAGLPADGRIRSFQNWLDMELARIVLEHDSAYLDPLIEKTYRLAMLRAHRLANSTAVPALMRDNISALQQLMMVELQGINEAVSQNLVRMGANAQLDKLQPRQLIRQMRVAVNQIGVTRSRALIAVMASKTHSTASLDTFEAAGVKRVGLIPETIAGKGFKRLGDADEVKNPGSRMSREEPPSGRTIRRLRKAAREQEEEFKGESVEVLTAGDDLVCPECEEISADGPYTIDEARSLIPAHPECRCAFVPEGSPLFANLLEFMA